MYSIPCDCGTCYIGGRSRPSEVRIKEHKQNLTQGLLEKKKSKLAQRDYEEGHKISWNEAKVFQIEPDTLSGRINNTLQPAAVSSLPLAPPIRFSFYFTDR
jgi:hypothetical protein